MKLVFMSTIKSILLVTVFLALSCQGKAQSETRLTKKKMTIIEKKQLEVLTLDPIEVPLENGFASAYFASGCFWCVEAVYESIIGVQSVYNGYSGGFTKNPTYESSNTGKTGHAEAVEVIYNPKLVSFATLVDVFFGSQNPTQINGQGPDRGSQYRSIIFYQNAAQKEIILKKKIAVAEQLKAKVAAEVYPFQKFWIGEDYHQNYERLHPNNRYIQGVSVPRLKRFQSKFPELVSKKH